MNKKKLTAKEKITQALDSGKEEIFYGIDKEFYVATIKSALRKSNGIWIFCEETSICDIFENALEDLCSFLQRDSVSLNIIFKKKPGELFERLSDSHREKLKSLFDSEKVNLSYFNVDEGYQDMISPFIFTDKICIQSKSFKSMEDNVLWKCSFNGDISSKISDFKKLEYLSKSVKLKNICG